MKVFEGLNGFKKLDFAVVTSGTFDGVHTGHQAVLNRVVDIAHKYNGESVLLTFWPHPRMVLNHKSDFLKLINSIEEKETILGGYGIDFLVKIPFTREFAETSSEDFIRNILVGKIGTRKLVIGYNHRFGKNREGNFENLVQHSHRYGFEVEEIPRHEVDHLAISSSIIRQALHEGDVETATRYMGRPYELCGVVIQGDKLGRTIGFPTANIRVTDDYKLVPGDGTYACRVLVDDRKYRGMMNIGIRPTLDGKQRRIEVHIIDFDGDIYGRKLTLHFTHRLRDEKKFESLEALKNQLTQDCERVKSLLSLS